MVDLSVLPAFLAVILLFLLPPGPDMAFMVAVGLESGRRPAVHAILGIGTGMSVYAMAVALGVAEVARTHPLLFDVVKLCGAAYLLRIGHVTMRGARGDTDGHTTGPTRRPYRRGILVTLTNVKVILFFLAVLPQFLGEARSAARQLALLGAINVAMEVLLYGVVGVMAGTFHAHFARSRRTRSALSYAAGGVYLLLAAIVIAELLAARFTR